MKLRRDFVTNSSSTSYIVRFPYSSINEYIEKHKDYFKLDHTSLENLKLLIAPYIDKLLKEKELNENDVGEFNFNLILEVFLRYCILYDKDRPGGSGLGPNIILEDTDENKE